MKTAVGADTPDPRQEIVQLLANWLTIRVKRELLQEQARLQIIRLQREPFSWWEKKWPE